MPEHDLFESLRAATRPPEIHSKVVGTCPHCPGVIIQTFGDHRIEGAGPTIWGEGDRANYRNASLGLHCEECGTKFAIVVNPIAEPPKAD